MNTVEIDCQIQALTAQKATLTTDLESSRQRFQGLSCEKDSFRSAALRNGDTNAKTELNKIRVGLAAAQLEAADILDELHQIESEITSLQTARVAAVREESWQEFLTLSAEAQIEAKNLDELVTEFFASLQPHAVQLHRMNQLLVRANVDGRGYSLQTLKHCLDERFRAGFTEFFGRQPRNFRKGSIFESPYSTVMAQRVEAARQRHDGVMVVEQDEEERERAVVNE